MITVGQRAALGLSEENHLLVIKDVDPDTRVYVDLGPYTKARCEQLCGFLKDLSIHVP